MVTKQSKLTPYVRVAPQRRPHLCPKDIELSKKLQKARSKASHIPEEKRVTTIWNAAIPYSATPCPRGVASRAAKERCDKGFGVNNTDLPCSSISDAINRLGRMLGPALRAKPFMARRDHRRSPLR